MKIIQFTSYVDYRRDRLIKVTLLARQLLGMQLLISSDEGKFDFRPIMSGLFHIINLRSF